MKADILPPYLPDDCGKAVPPKILWREHLAILGSRNRNAQDSISWSRMLDETDLISWSLQRLTASREMSAISWKGSTS
ncbi:MAG TPA: hypothetical protein VIY66_02710 [Candidatus Acidoferrales bacterium]